MSAAATKQHLNLILDQGGPLYLGFNPIGPRSHRWWMHFKCQPKVRVFGWVLWRTIDRDREGKTGPPKMTRTAFAHDTRVSKSGHLEAKHVAEDLGLTLANAIDELRQLEKEERITIDEKGRISPNANSPEPRRIEGEDTGEGSEVEEPIFLCTENCPEAIRLSFQQLDRRRRTQYARLYRKMPPDFARHLETLEDEPRGMHTWNYLRRAEYKQQLEADALAAARAYGRDVVEQGMAEAGYQDTETRGRKEVDRDLTIQIEVRVDPENFFAQKTGADCVQSRNSNLYKGKNGSAQKTPSLLTSSTGLHSSHSEVESADVENPASEQKKEAASPQPQTPTPPATPLKTFPKEVESPSDEPDDPLRDPNPVIDSVQHLLKRKLAPHDPLQTKFPELATRFGIPLCSVCRWISETAEKKERAGYKIHSPGALYEFAENDLPNWIPARRREIADDAAWEARVRGIEQAFDPLDYNGTMKALAAKKGMS